MKFFITETERKAAGGTCYFEFQKGKFRNKFWLSDSLYLHADLFDSLKLHPLFSASIENFDYYGPNNVDQDKWNNLLNTAKENAQWDAFIEELKPWAEKSLNESKCFTILGI